MGGFERFNDLLFGHFPGASLDHHQAVLAARDDEIELAFLALGERRIDDVLAADETNPHAGDGLLERNIRKGQRR